MTCLGLATLLPESKRLRTKVPTEIYVVDKYKNTSGDYRVEYKIPEMRDTNKLTISYEDYDKIKIGRLYTLQIAPKEYTSSIAYTLSWVGFWFFLAFSTIFGIGSALGLND